MTLLQAMTSQMSHVNSPHEITPTLAIPLADTMVRMIQ